VKVGYHADLVVFDPERVRDAATFANPEQAADGIDAVWVNGVLTYREAALTGERAGRFVARGAASKLDAAGAF
jgi:N-acyl-D-amino-acid deacylase